MFKNGLLRTCGEQLPSLRVANWKGFIRFLAGINQGGCIFSSIPLIHSSFQLIRDSWIFYSHAKSFHHINIFVSYSFHNGQLTTFSSVIEFKHLFLTFWERKVSKQYVISSRSIDWWENSFPRLTEKVDWTIS